MSLSKEIRQLIGLAAATGPTTAPRMREHTVKKKPVNPQHPEAVAKAKPAADAIFAWLAGPVGQEMRAEMVSSGARFLPLHGWRVCATQEPGVLHTRRESNPQMGPFDNTHSDVRTGDDLIKAVGPEIVVSIHEYIVQDRLFTHMAEHLRQLRSA